MELILEVMKDGASSNVLTILVVALLLLLYFERSHEVEEKKREIRNKYHDDLRSFASDALAQIEFSAIQKYKVIAEKLKATSIAVIEEKKKELEKCSICEIEARVKEGGREYPCGEECLDTKIKKSVFMHNIKEKINTEISYHNALIENVTKDFSIMQNVLIISLQMNLYRDVVSELSKPEIFEKSDDDLYDYCTEVSGGLLRKSLSRINSMIGVGSVYYAAQSNIRKKEMAIESFYELVLKVRDLKKREASDIKIAISENSILPKPLSNLFLKILSKEE